MYHSKHEKPHMALHKIMDYVSHCTDVIIADESLSMMEKLTYLGECTEMLEESMAAHADMCEIYDTHKKHNPMAAKGEHMMKPSGNPY